MKANNKDIEENMGGSFQPYRTRSIRFLVLFLASMAVFGNQYAFNNPQALEQFMHQDLHISNTQFQLLYTIFSFPNIFASFFIGFLIDYIGVRVGLLALSAGVVIFQLLIAAGGFTYSYITILIGRMLFGLVSVSLITAQASLVSFWFKGKELAFALGIALTFPQFGNALNSFASPLIYEATSSLGVPLLVSVFVCLLSFMCALGAAYIDKKADQHDESHKIFVVQSHQNLEEEMEKIKWKDLKKFTITFWLLVTLSMFGEGLYVPFMDGANKLFIERFCFTPVEAGKALTITYLVAAIFSAPIGLLIDKIGFKRYFIMCCMSIFTLGQLTILITPQCSGNQSSKNGSKAGLVLIGLGYCLYGNCVLPSIALVVKKKVTGTAFGITQMIECIASAFFPLINGVIIQNGNKNASQRGYLDSSIFFLSIGCLGMLISLGLLLIPEKYKKRLDRVSKQETRLGRQGQKGQLYFTTSDFYESDDSSTSTGKQIQIIRRANSLEQLLNAHGNNRDL